MWKRRLAPCWWHACFARGSTKFCWDHEFLSSSKGGGVGALRTASPRPCPVLTAGSAPSVAPADSVLALAAERWGGNARPGRMGRGSSQSSVHDRARCRGLLDKHPPAARHAFGRPRPPAAAAPRSNPFRLPRLDRAQPSVQRPPVGPVGPARAPRAWPPARAEAAPRARPAPRTRRGARTARRRGLRGASLPSRGSARCHWGRHPRGRGRQSHIFAASPGAVRGPTSVSVV